MADLRTQIELIVEKLQQQGWRVTHSKHWKAVPPDRTKPIVFLSSSPSDPRSLGNVRALLRKSGARL